ncbi:MAG: ABC transporter substrate-binding protein [Chloroflexi bacterium]|nr:ABC transporter substrate-binding protein [Chloroflexota bacterium]
MLKRTSLILLLIGLLVLAGVQASAQDGMTVLRFPITSDPASLEPGLVKELFSGQLALNMHAGLFTYDAETNVVPYLVSDYEVSEDGLVYTFRLREDALWHNGRAVVAEDFKKGWERYLDPNVGAQTAGEPWAHVVGGPELYAGEAEELTGVQALDEHTLQVTLTQPSLSFLQDLAVPVTWVVPSEAVVEGQPAWVGDPVGAGPFKFVEWTPNVRIVLEANPDFFLGKPAVDRIEFLVVPDASTAMAQFEGGELDIVAVPASDLERVTNDPTLGSQLAYFTRAQLQYAGMNQSMFEPFQDARVRQAFNYAIDRTTLAENILSNSWTVATGLVPSAHPGIQRGPPGLCLRSGDGAAASRRRRLSQR